MSFRASGQGYGHAVSESGNPISPEDDEAESAEAPETPETPTQDNPDVDDE